MNRLNLNNETTLNGVITLNKQSGTVLTLQTQQQYIDKSIQLILNAPAASFNLKGGNLNNQTAFATFNNATVSSTNTSGISIQTQGSVGRDAILYDGAVSGWVSAANNDICSPAVASSSWNGQNYYLTGVNLTNGNAFDITVPNGSGSTITFHFAVDANGNTTVS